MTGNSTAEHRAPKTFTRQDSFTASRQGSRATPLSWYLTKQSRLLAHPLALTGRPCWPAWEGPSVVEEHLFGSSSQFLQDLRSTFILICFSSIMTELLQVKATHTELFVSHELFFGPFRNNSISFTYFTLVEEYPHSQYILVVQVVPWFQHARKLFRSTQEPLDHGTKDHGAPEPWK